MFSITYLIPTAIHLFNLIILFFFIHKIEITLFLFMQTIMSTNNGCKYTAN